MDVASTKRRATTTIRVSAETRDKLAAEAERVGKSLAALLENYAWLAEREAWFAEARRAGRKEAADGAVMQEQADWQQVSGDVVDK